MSAFVKHLREHGMSTAEVMVWRMAPGLPLIFFELRRSGARLWPRRPGVVGMRIGFGGLAMSTNFWAVQYLTLVQNTVLHLAQPVFVATLSPVVLRERLRGAAIVALVLALLGALAVIRPDHLLTGAAAIVPLVPGIVGLLSALFSAMAHMCVRMATGVLKTTRWPPLKAEPDAPETVVFHFTLNITLVALLIGVVQGGFQALPDGMTLLETAWKIAAMAALGATGQLMMSRAYAAAPAPAVAMVAYAGIPASMVLDVLAWGAPVTGSSLLGALMMVVAGVLLVRAQPTGRP
jgi:drug/metabolite transporter (DMT)-like permease